MTLWFLAFTRRPKPTTHHAYDVHIQAQLIGHAAKTFWIPLVHLDEIGKFPASSRERVKIADVPSSMELINDPGIKVRAGLYYKKA